MLKTHLKIRDLFILKREQWFGDQTTIVFSVQSKNLLYLFFRSIWNNDLEHVSQVRSVDSFTSRCDLDLWTFHLERLYSIGCHVVEPCTKF